MKHLLIISQLFFAATVFAQVSSPVIKAESGYWWNPAESGRGYAIEIQDKIVFMTVYAYAGDDDPDSGSPHWFTVSGELQGNAIESELVLNEQGQCLGCDPQEPISTFTGQNVSLVFQSDRQAQLTINGNTIGIQRFLYTDTLIQPISRLLGQWKIITDYSELSDDQYPFEADVLIIDQLADDGLSASGQRASSGEAVTANLEGDVVVIRVTETSERDLLYRVPMAELGSDRFLGSAERVQTQSSASGLGFPSEAFRAAGRSFVEQERALKQR